MNTTHLSKGNTKTGDAASFDIPAIKTCPSRTELCAKDCYAAKLMRIYRNVNAKYERNLRLANSKGFVLHMIEHIPSNCNMRIHVSGDYYSVEYIDKWIQIVSSRKDVTFYAYTRSWRDPSLRRSLKKLASLPNININLSVDDETGKPKFAGADHFRWCYLSRDDTAPNWLRRDDIVFRTNHNGHKRRRQNAIKNGQTPPMPIHRLIGKVCPLERGLDVPVTCSTCRLCIDKPK